jgi:hypothetical protein
MNKYTPKTDVNFARIRECSLLFPADKKAGLTVPQIAEKHRVSIPTVRKYLKNPLPFQTAKEVFLPNDVARCDGIGSVENGVKYWRDGCDTCLRRTAQRKESVWMMSPPPIIAFECEYIILPTDSREPRGI